MSGEAPISRWGSRVLLELGILEPLRSRFAFAQSLRPFGLEDTRNYIRFHIQRAEGPKDLFSDEAVKTVTHPPRTVPCVHAVCLLEIFDPIATRPQCLLVIILALENFNQVLVAKISEYEH